jgi:hypothetical protein
MGMDDFACVIHHGDIVMIFRDVNTEENQKKNLLV